MRVGVDEAGHEDVPLTVDAGNVGICLLQRGPGTHGGDALPLHSQGAVQIDAPLPVYRQDDRLVIDLHGAPSCSESMFRVLYPYLIVKRENRLDNRVKIV